MSKRTSSRSGLFLLELIISILFFSVASAICIQLFVKAHLMDKNNQALTQSIKLSQNFAEIYTATNGDLDAIKKFYPEATITLLPEYNSNRFRIDYNANWKYSTSENAVYCMDIRFSENTTTAGVMRTAHITVFEVSGENREFSDISQLHVSEDSIIHQIDISVYISNRGGAADEE